MHFALFEFGFSTKGVHAVLMRLWGNKSGPCMQFVHAAFALGAFIAPLIAKPFIQDIPNTEDDCNSSFVFNVSCNVTETSVTCIRDSTIAEICNKTASAAINIYYDNTSNCSVVSDESLTLRYGWAYWISAMFLVIPLIAFTYYAIRYDTTVCLKKKGTQGNNCLGIRQDEENKGLLVNGDAQKSITESITDTNSSQYLCYLQVSCLCTSLSLYLLLCWIRAFIWKSSVHICS